MNNTQGVCVWIELTSMSMCLYVSNGFISVSPLQYSPTCIPLPFGEIAMHHPFLTMLDYTKRECTFFLWNGSNIFDINDWVGREYEL